MHSYALNVKHDVLGMSAAVHTGIPQAQIILGVEFM